MKSSTTSTYVLLSVFAFLIAAGLLTPKFFADSGEGLAAGATAALAFLCFSGLAVLCAIYLFIASLCGRKSLSKAAFLAGLLPLPLCFAGGVILWLVIRSA